MPLILLKIPNQLSKHNGILETGNHFFFAEVAVLVEEVDEKSADTSITCEVKDELEDEYKIITKSSFYVPPAGFGIGKFVASDSFATCQIILAKLAKDNYALFHSSDHLLSSSFDCFYERIKNQVEHFYFFTRENPVNQNYKFRACSLYLDLVAKMGSANKVTNFLVDNYRGIIVDGERNQLFITRADFKYSTVDKINDLLSKEEPIKLDPIVKLKTLDEVKNEMAEILKIMPELIAGENKYVREIRKNLKKKPELPKMEFKYNPVYDEKEDVGNEDDLKVYINGIVKKQANAIASAKIFRYFSTPGAADKAKKILKSLDVANANFSIVTLENIEKFLDYSEGDVPSLKKALLDASAYKSVMDELYKSLDLTKSKYTAS